ncbi:MAG: STAS domain-containing protein [Anaerolineae bacterium]|nr:STAS domain-containing protein [Anaerolineae bacterium]
MLQAKVITNVRKMSDKASIVDIHGEVNAAAENSLMSAFNQASASHARAVVLNFRGLEYMNSSGIGLLVTLLIRANRQGQKVMATGLSDHYRQIFELTRLNEAIHIYDTEAQALAAANAM